MTEQQMFFAMLALVAFLIGLSKGGLGGTLGALATPLMALVMPADKALGLLLPLLMVGDIFAVAFYWRQWNGRLALWLIPGAFVGVVLGTVVIIDAPTALLETILGIVILVFVVYKLYEERILGAINYQPKNWHSLVAGSVAGLASTLAHNGGPPISIYLLAQDLAPVLFVATSAIFFFVLNWIKLPFYLYAGVFDVGLLRSDLWVLPLVIAGVFLGRWMALRISRIAFERVIIVLLLITAALLIFKPGNGGAATRKAALAGPIPSQAVMRLGRGDLRALDLSPDGTALAAGGSAGLALLKVDTLDTLWQTATAAPVTSVAFAEDGALVAAGLKNGATAVIEAGSGRVLATLPAQADDQQVTALAWTALSEGGRELAVGYDDGEVTLGSVVGAKSEVEAEAAGRLPSRGAAVGSLAFDPSGTLLAIGDHEGGVGLWNVQTQTDAGALAAKGSGDSISQLLWLEDGVHLLAGGADGHVTSWDVKTKTAQPEFANHTASVLALAELGDHRPALIDGEGAVVTGAAAPAQGSGDRPGLVAAPLAAAWSKQGRLLAAADAAGNLTTWQSKQGPASEAGARNSTFAASGAQANAVAVSPDGKQIASGLGADILLWDAASGSLLRTLAGHRRNIGALAYSPDGATLASGGWDGDVILWNAKSGDKLRTLQGHKRDVAGLAWSPDGKRLASTGSGDNQVLLWNPATGEVEATLKGTDQGVWGLAWSPDGKTLAVSTSLADILLWDMTKPELSASPDGVLRGHSNWVSTLAWSPDGAKLASGGADRLVIVWDVANRRRFQSLPGSTDVVRAVAFSPDGSALATAGLDQQVRIWPVAQGVDRPTAVLAGHTGPVDDLAWLPDGGRLASASEDGTVLIWNLKGS